MRNMIIHDNILFILTLVFPLMVIFMYIKDLIYSIKQKNKNGIISESMFLLFIIILTVIYINIILNND